MKWGIAALFALTLAACGGPNGSSLFGTSAAPSAPEPDGGAPAPDGRAAEPDSGASGGATTGGATGSPDAASAVGKGSAGGVGNGGAGGAPAANGGAASGGAASGGMTGSGGRSATGGATLVGGMTGAGGAACSTPEHCAYPRVSDGCPCENQCPAECAAYTTVERHVGAQGVMAETLVCSGPCVSNAAKDCCVPEPSAVVGCTGSNACPAGQLCEHLPGASKPYACARPLSNGGASCFAGVPPPGSKCAWFCASQPLGCQSQYQNCAALVNPSTGTDCATCSDPSLGDFGTEWSCGPQI